ncbi:hypothetical protein SAMN06265222_10392 [Neorhodopirellula lusitana]|uniref:Uncharacterized protein n=1 Tax=Neorhodopirellula lusitana TaxID=445327 RepID=A0ABY1PVT0_9BACT|nr:hypothetical protein [Neorhodopirellula lusitana]SMP50407.1 hypothetical protein SAMN06265222_10392 [Neorhodopirellula lusitana]
MANQNLGSELEAFLKHTASLRQRKTIEQRVEASQQRERQERRPQHYTSANRERHVDDSAARFGYDRVDPNEIIVNAEIVDSSDEIVEGIEVVPGRAGRLEHLEADNTIRGRSKPTKTIEHLKQMLREPDGLRQAFLLREILERPRF